MKNSELTGLSKEELKNKLAAEQLSLRNLKFAHAVTPIENPMKIKEARKLIARVKTEIRSKELSK